MFKLLKKLLKQSEVKKFSQSLAQGKLGPSKTRALLSEEIKQLEAQGNQHKIGPKFSWHNNLTLRRCVSVPLAVMLFYLTSLGLCLRPMGSLSKQGWSFAMFMTPSLGIHT